MYSIKAYGQDALEVILVLDGLELTLDHFKHIGLEKLIIESLEENKGPAFARNHGASIASGNVLFFMDSDVELLPSTLTIVKSHFSKNNDSDALIGSYDNNPSSHTLVSKYRNLLHHHTHQLADKKATTFWGACGAIKKEVFQGIGGFSISFDKPSVEDIELGYRLKEKGYNIVLDPGLQVKHLKKWTFINMVQTDIFNRARPWTKLLHRYKKLGVNDLNINYQERLAIILLVTGFISLILSIRFHFLLPISLISFSLLLLIKRKTYFFFTKHFKWYQIPIVVLLHWAYLTSAFIGFSLGTIDVFFSPNEKNNTEADHISNKKAEENLVFDE